jgi:hypothetical protein
MPADSSDPFEECLFLYREFSTEAIRILVRQLQWIRATCVRNRLQPHLCSA